MTRMVLTLVCVFLCAAVTGCSKHHGGGSSSVELIAPSNGTAKATSAIG